MEQIIRSFKNPLIKRLVNVYQKTDFINGKPPGFGDYLRGSICMYQVAKLLQLDFDLDMNNHPLSNFLIERKKNPINNEQLYRFENLNYNGDTRTTNSESFFTNFVEHLNSLSNNHPNLVDGTYYLFFNSFPIFTKYSMQVRDFISSKLMPNIMMEQNMALKFKALQIDPKTYDVIHIRCGDTFIYDVHVTDTTHTAEKGTTICKNKAFIDNIIQTLEKYINPNKKYVILSDNNEIKLIIKKRFRTISYVAE